MARLCDSAVEQIAGNDERSAACSSMTVNENSFAHFVESAYVLANSEDQFVCWTSQIFPVPVKRCNADGLENFWIIREANFVIDPIAAQSVLPWLLQVNYYPDVQTNTYSR